MTLREALLARPSAMLRRDAEMLALHVLRRDRAWLHAHPDAELTDAQASAFAALIERRARGEPLQYLTGHQEFFGLDLHVTPDVLIPRPETEHLVEAVLAWAQGEQTQTTSLEIVDVGTGSGAIALALAAKLPQARMTAVDVSDRALALAGKNAACLGLAGRVRFVRSDLLQALEPELATGKRFDAIVSNPPYVALRDAAALAPEVREFEPPLALFAGEDGLDVYRRLLPAAAVALRKGGFLAMEFGFAQCERVEALFAAQGGSTWGERHVTADLQGIPRVVEAIRV